LEPRRRAEQALVAVVQEAYVNGVSTRKVDRLVEQLGLHHLSKDQVSRLCRGLDEQVRVFRERPLEGCHPYVWLDAKLERVRHPGGVRHKALVIAYGVYASGRREVIGVDVGEAETAAFWREFLRSLRERGLDGVKLCISDAHAGLKAAIVQVLGCPWQRCTVHFLRDMLGHVSRAQQPLVSGAIRGIFTATTAADARGRLGQVVEQLRPHAPKVARLLEDAEPDLLAFYGFPAEHWPKLRSTNPLERVNREIGRRSDVVGIFPNDAALLRLAALPKAVHPGARKALAEIRDAPDRQHAERAIELFARDYGVNWPKAVAKITGDAEALLCFFDYPAEHWVHLKTSNPIESTFATVRLRTRVTKGPGSKAAGLAMAFKLLEAAQDRWRAVNGPHLVALVRAGARFEKGVMVERPDEAQEVAA